MAKITLVIDTEEETIAGDIDGKAFPDKIESVYVNNYQDYKGNPCLSWSVSICHPTDDQDFKACTNFCSAAEKNYIENAIKSIPNLGVKKVRNDVDHYFKSKRGK